MKRLILLITSYCLPAILSAGLLVTGCFAEVISSRELIERAKEFDGKVITYQGEAIGEVMLRGDSAWVNLNDGDYAIGTWMSKELALGISFCGSYKERGDWLEVEGIFHRACPEHGADLDIHAQRLVKIKEGKQKSHPLNLQKKILAIYLGGIALCLLTLRLFRAVQFRRLTKQKAGQS